MKKIQVLGTGCPKCQKLVEAADRVASKAGLEFEIEKVTKIDEIVAMGVMATPALAVDGKVVVSGRIPNDDELHTLLG